MIFNFIFDLVFHLFFSISSANDEVYVDDTNVWCLKHTSICLIRYTVFGRKTLLERSMIITKTAREKYCYLDSFKVYKIFKTTSFV